MDLRIEGRTAVVLGATGGIGAAVCQSLDVEGANVVIVGRDQSRTREHAAALRSSTEVVVDLADLSSARTIFNKAMDAFGSIDILVLNGGGPSPGTAVAMTSRDLDEAMVPLVQTHIELVRLALPSMREQRWGRIIGVGSSGIHQPIANLVLSNVGRAALSAYLKTLAGEVAADGVTVNMALPGRIETNRLRELDASAAQRRDVSIDRVRSDSLQSIPAGRYGSPNEFAALVTFLASDVASYVTGEEVRCDGGLVRSR